MKSQLEAIAQNQRPNQHQQQSGYFASRTNLVAALSELQMLSAASSAKMMASANSSGVAVAAGIQPIASHRDILHLYQENARKLNNPALQLEFSLFLLDYAETIGDSDYAIRVKYQNEAMEWLRKLAFSSVKDEKDLQAQSNAQFHLAECLRLGLYQQCDLQGAWKLYESASKRGHPTACYRAGICCEQGIGRKVNLSRALLYYRKAAGMIHFPSMFKLITIYVYHPQEYNVSKSAYEGFKWLKIVATHVMNNPVECDLYALACLYELGMWYAEGPPQTAPIPDFTLDHEYAIELIYEAGRRGYSPAAFKLGDIFERGLYGVRSDKTSALFWYKRVLTYENAGEDNFVTVDEWKRSAQRRIGHIRNYLQRHPEESQQYQRQQQQQKSVAVEQHRQVSANKHHQQQHPQLQQRSSSTHSLQKRLPEEPLQKISDNGQRILNVLSSRKKLRRKSTPAPINTTHLQRPRPLPQKQSQRPASMTTSNHIRVSKHGSAIMPHHHQYQHQRSHSVSRVVSTTSEVSAALTTQLPPSLLNSASAASSANAGKQQRYELRSSVVRPGSVIINNQLQQQQQQRGRSSVSVAEGLEDFDQMLREAASRL